MTTMPMQTDDNASYNSAESSAIPTIDITSIKMRRIVTVTHTVFGHQEQTRTSSKGNGENMLKNRMNENFRKASAFWKAT